MINKLFILSAIFLSSFASQAGPIIVGSGAGESEYSILFARTHLDELLSICAEDQCHLNSPQKLWLQRARKLAFLVPEAIFKNSQALGSQIYVRRTRSKEVWFNQDLLWLDPSSSKPYQVSDAVVLWLDILLGDKNISKAELSSLELELGAYLKDQVQLIISSGETTGGFSALLWTHQNRNDDLFLRDQAFQTFSVQESLQKAGLCSVGDASQLKFYSARWTSIQEQKNLEPTLMLRLEVSASWTCGTQSGRGRILIIMNAEKKNSYEIDPKSIRSFAEGDLK